jgi:hypothetical protein
VDDVGAAQLAAGMGHPVGPGLLYVGKAGGHRPSAEPSTSTLWDRVAGNHLRGKVRGSTLRKSLAAILGAAGEPVSEADLTAWMQAHLRVAVLPVASELVGQLAEELVSRADPPLNLAGAPRHAARWALTRLRGLLSGPLTETMASSEPVAGSEAVTPSTERPAEHNAVQEFERRIRRDVAAMVRAGYRPTIFQRMVAERGAVGAARQLLGAGALSDGFRWLWEHRMLQHSVENAVLDETFADLFSADEREVARRRLRDAGRL